MKNFFKKLSFVMALAMIVTALAPASGVFAAAAPKLNKSLVYLHVAESTTEFDFNIANKKDGWKYKWTSSNEDVADVNAKNGVTEAVGKGTATVSVVITDKAGTRVKKLSAKVVVRDNIKKLTITNVPAGNKLAVGAKNDFNRSYVTASGSKTKTSGITRWEVSSATGATIVANSGLFTADAAGKYTITARAFQSTAKYDSWLSDKTKYAKYVTASASVDVTVANSIKAVEQVDLDTFKVTFDSAVTDAATKLSAAYLVNTTEIAAAIKKVTMDTTNKIATVDMYANFSKGSTYVIKYPDVDNGQFVAATTNVADVKEIKVTTTEVPANKESDVKVSVLNAKGVDLSGDSDLLSRVYLSSSNSNLYLNGKKITMYNVGDTTKITAQFHTYTYDSTTGAEQGVLSAEGTITCVAKLNDKASGVVAYHIGGSAPADAFVDVKHAVAVGDSAKKLWVKINIDKPYDDDVTATFDGGALSEDGFQYESSNNNVLIIGSNGTLIPVASGTAYVVVKYKKEVAGTVEVSVGAKRAVGTISLNSNYVTLSNSALVNDSAKLEVSVKDQYGDTLDAGQYTVAIENTAKPSTGTALTWGTKTEASGTSVKAAWPFDAANTYKGAYQFKITVTDNNTKDKKDVWATINVAEPTDNTVSYVRVESDATSYDTKLNKDSGDDNNRVASINVFGYSSNGVKNMRYKATDVSTEAMYIKITYAGDNKGTLTNGTGTTASTSAAKLDLVPFNGSNEAVKATKGTYLVKVVSGSAEVASSTFTVTDSTALPTVTVKKVYMDKDDTSLSTTNLDEIFSVSFGGNAYKFADASSKLTIASGDYESGANGEYFIKKITFTDDVNNKSGKKVVYKIDVNTTVVIK